ncbi:helix-turn-helix domain-containing protein [Neisseria sp. 23W00296]|nr:MULTISPECIES: helix-turn-helix transcriptional regulator [unclassified Neisseria]
MKIYEKIRALREERQWSQEELAVRLGLSANGYAKN